MHDADILTCFICLGNGSQGLTPKIFTQTNFCYVSISFSRDRTESGLWHLAHRNKEMENMYSLKLLNPGPY